MSSYHFLKALDCGSFQGDKILLKVSCLCLSSQIANFNFEDKVGFLFIRSFRCSHSHWSAKNTYLKDNCYMFILVWARCTPFLQITVLNQLVAGKRNIQNFSDTGHHLKLFSGKYTFLQNKRRRWFRMPPPPPSPLP